jgi:hypothetical protein
MVAGKNMLIKLTISILHAEVARSSFQRLVELLEHLYKCQSLDGGQERAAKVLQNREIGDH